MKARLFPKQFYNITLIVKNVALDAANLQRFLPSFGDMECRLDGLRSDAGCLEAGDHAACWCTGK